MVLKDFQSAIEGGREEKEEGALMILFKDLEEDFETSSEWEPFEF